ncbi:CMRF35-like molecule 1 isoform X1 [Tursiops truncatus]|uniref:CMRF35-like molecule 1 isoform X1 n=1 Tax=Tursiops truncatus TaxID=9739 RepID=A0A2U3V3B6_TURTR|nr:CMRF35-like molecule 1 isoform X1 [Tursiops truncatus]
MHLLLLFYLLRRLAGSSAITGPGAVSGPEGGSLTVKCQYSPGWETYEKWWCRGAAWSSCKFVVKTTEPEKEVKEGRVSIRDNRKSRTIAVTMEKLRLNDADSYWCGIEKFGTDLGVRVKVTINPAPSTVPATTPATSAINVFTVSVNLEETSDSLAVTSPDSNSGSVFLKANTLLPFIFAVLLLLLMVTSLVVWRMMKQQKKAAEISAEQVLQPKEGDMCYANLSLQQTENSGSSQKKASTRSSSPAQANAEEVEYVTMTPFLREGIACAALSLETSDQEPTYSNMECFITRIPSRSHEEPTEYSAIRKP